MSASSANTPQSAMRASAEITTRKIFVHFGRAKMSFASALEFVAGFLAVKKSLIFILLAKILAEF